MNFFNKNKKVLVPVILGIAVVIIFSISFSSFFRFNVAATDYFNYITNFFNDFFSIPITCPRGTTQCGSSLCCSDNDYKCVNNECVLIGFPGYCVGKECGDDGSGGSCGTCPAGKKCNALGKCVSFSSPCIPNCSNKSCGSNGCGGSCGTCPTGKQCNASGKCVSSCIPNCSNRKCGSNGCGGSCGTCPPGKKCDVSGKCIIQGFFPCIPNCSNKSCGNNGCGGSCGECSDGYYCSYDNKCKENECYGKNNGTDCNYSSTLGFQGVCLSGKCLNCNPVCNKECQRCSIVSGKAVCTNKSNITSCNYSSTLGFQGVCLSGKCLNCNPVCNKECQSCSAVNGVAKCVNKSNITSCNYSSTLGFQGVCLSGKCLNCNPVCNKECQRCSAVNGVAKCVNKNNGTECDYISGVGYQGICNKGKCETSSEFKEECETLGLGTPCGPKSSSGLNCCSDEESCCNSQVCCTKENPDCKTLFGVSFCSSNKESCPSDKPQICPGSGGSWKVCCAAEDACVTIGGIGYCGEKDETKCKPGEKACGTVQGGVFCCKPENCVINAGIYPECVITECEAGKQLCPGVGNYAKKGICCDKETEVCATQPNGYPRCVPDIGATTDETIIIPGTTTDETIVPIFRTILRYGEKIFASIGLVIGNIFEKTIDWLKNKK